eukprot:TRINITY_DN46452_c0_g1_i1.p2 TRINITY_DN46452_c0_g1~~TRINITY_DN46452_c0_g1_i1.p2  ORF type:complete len:112 (+),score=23.93 TRINITY_DN46452_c0_g1_i1:425-760(+)
MPLWLCGTILARDVGLIFGASYLKMSTIERPITLKKLFFSGDSQQVEIQASNISKFNTFLQFLYITGCITQPVLGLPDPEVMHYFGYVVCTTTVWSGLDYAFLSRAGVKRI